MREAEWLRALVAVDTTSARSNLEAADLVCDGLDRPGVAVLRLGLRPEEKVNVVAWLGPPADPLRRDGLVLAGHLDCVPAHEPEWASDPFRLLETETAFVGRGTADMKGFIALAVGLARGLEPSRLAHPLVLVLTYDEEVGTVGARHLLDLWPRERPLPRAAVVGEPTSLRPARMHKGHLRLRVRLRGRSAHSGYPHLGVNAIEKAGPVLEALARLRRELERERPPASEHFPEVPYVPLNVGTIAGGSAVNVVPDRCEVELGLRHLPGMSAEDLVARVREALSPALGDGELEVVNESPPFLLEEKAEVHRALVSIAGEGRPAVSFATDAGWLQRLGLECVLFGPGSIEVAHRPNEFVPKADLKRARDVLDALVHRFCREGGRA